MHQSHFAPRLLTQKTSTSSRFFGNRRLRVGASLLGMYLVMMIGFSYVFTLQTNYTGSNASASDNLGMASITVDSLDYKVADGNLELDITIENGSSSDYISGISLELVTTKDIVTWVNAEPENKIVNYFYPQSSKIFDLPSQSPLQKSSYKIRGKILDRGNLTSTIVAAKVNYKQNSNTKEITSNKEFVSIDQNQRVDLKTKKPSL
jgi:hypothetical protein